MTSGWSGGVTRISGGIPEGSAIVGHDGRDQKWGKWWFKDEEVKRQSLVSAGLVESSEGKRLV